MAQKKIKVKPGKTQSKMGFIVGILFVIIEKAIHLRKNHHG